MIEILLTSLSILWQEKGKNLYIPLTISCLFFYEHSSHWNDKDWKVENHEKILFLLVGWRFWSKHILSKTRFSKDTFVYQRRV
jgi:hypothetical protein